MMLTNTRVAAMVFVAIASGAITAAPQTVVHFGPFEIPESNDRTKTATLHCPREFVQGFPVIFKLHVENVASHKDSFTLFDLATAGGDQAVSLYLVGATGDSYRIARGASNVLGGPPRRGYAAEGLWYQPGGTADMWMEIEQLIAIAAPWQGPPEWQDSAEDEPGLLRSGTWRMAFKSHGLPVTISEEFTVRPPNEAERTFLEHNKLDNTSLPWFPMLVLSDQPVPEPNALPPETRRLVSLLKVVHEAVRSCDRGLHAIAQTRSEDWGYLNDLVRNITYECLLDAGRQAAATALRIQELGDNPNDISFDAIDAGKGMIAQYREVMREQLPLPVPSTAGLKNPFDH